MIETWIESGMLLNRKGIVNMLFHKPYYKIDLQYNRLNINEALLSIVEGIDGNVWQAYLIKEGYDKACRTIIRHIRAEYGTMINRIQAHGLVDMRETVKEILYRLANAQELREGGFEFMEEERRLPVYPGELKPGDYIWTATRRAKQIETQEEVDRLIYEFRTGVSNIDRFATEEEIILHKI